MLKKIYYYDTDCGGIVYYANYLKYFEEARTEYMLECGLDLKELSEKGILFVVKRVEIEYKSPARYGDILEVSTKLTKIRNVSFDFFQVAKPSRKNREDKVIVWANTTLVCIDANFRPIAIPQEIARCLAK